MIDAKLARRLYEAHSEQDNYATGIDYINDSILNNILEYRKYIIEIKLPNWWSEYTYEKLEDSLLSRGFKVGREKNFFEISFDI